MRRVRRERRICEQRSWVRGTDAAIAHRTASVLVSAIERRREESPSVPVAEAETVVRRMN